MPNPCKILLGGVPFGCDNVGDEAILECAVRIFREACPGCSLTAATADPKTAQWLDIQVCDLLGFVPNKKPDALTEVMRRHDVFVWCGATGLSDYPEVPTRLMRAAQAAGLKTIVWGVGMNDELNPALYRLLPGKRRRALQILTGCTLNTFDAVAYAERRGERRARLAIAETLNAADLVVVRDPDTETELRRSGVTRMIVVGADSALTLQSTPLETVSMPESVRSALESDVRKIGVCISAQRRVANQSRLIEYLDRITEDDTTRVVFIPMNPLTDAELMRDLQAGMAHKQRTTLFEGRHTPNEVLAVVAKMDLILSSRLHLLIFASIVDVPMIGISRGSKVDSFLRPLGIQTVGSTEECDFGLLFEETQRLLNHREEFASTCRRNRIALMDRLAVAKQRLQETLNS